jgi:DNA-binding transcriptional LysR family regulator
MDARPYEWSDLEIFLATARAGTLAAAADALRVDASTVHRRVGKLEAAMRAKLFVRSQRGYALTEVGQELHVHALAMEEQAAAAFRKVAARDEQPLGKLRISTVDDLAFHILPPIIAEFRARHPNITVEVDVRESFADLSKNEADIALRYGPRVLARTTDGDVVVRKLLVAHFALYASRGYVKVHGKPKTLEDLADHACVRLPSHFVGHPMEALLERHGDPAKIAFRSSSFHVCRSAIRAGIGIGLAPVIHAADDKVLVQLDCIPPGVGGDLVMIIHADLRRNARVRAFVDHASAAFEAMRERF